MEVPVNPFSIRVAAFGGGILIRLVLLYFKMDEILSYRPELSTPITSIHRGRSHFRCTFMFYEYSSA